MAMNAGYFSDSEEHGAVEEWREDEETYDGVSSPILGCFFCRFSAVFAAVFRVDDLESAENLAIIAVLFLLGAAIWIFLNGELALEVLRLKIIFYFSRRMSSAIMDFKGMRGNPRARAMWPAQSWQHLLHELCSSVYLGASSAMRQLYLHVIDETSQGEKGTRKLSIYKNSENGKRIGNVESKVLKYEVTRIPKALGGIISTQFAALLRNMWNDEFEVFAPTGFKKFFGKRHGRFAMYLQEDANEFLASLLRDLHEDLNCASNRKIRQRGDSFDHLDNQEREKRMDANTAVKIDLNFRTSFVVKREVSLSVAPNVSVRAAHLSPCGLWSRHS